MPSKCKTPSLILTFLTSYNSKVHQHIPKLTALLSGLEKKDIIPAKVVIIHTIPQPENREAWSSEWVSWDDFVGEGRATRRGRTPSGEIEWNRLPFDYPLWILFSSGTTGRPKYVLNIAYSCFRTLIWAFLGRPIVHRAGGMLLQAKKEFVICGDLQPDDVFFYYTTTSVCSYLASVFYVADADTKGDG